MEDDFKFFLFKCPKCDQFDNLTEKNLANYVYPVHGKYKCPYGCGVYTLLFSYGSYEENNERRDAFMAEFYPNKDYPTKF